MNNPYACATALDTDINALIVALNSHQLPDLEKKKLEIYLNEERHRVTTVLESLGSIQEMLKLIEKQKINDGWWFNTLEVVKQNETTKTIIAELELASIKAIINKIINMYDLVLIPQQLSPPPPPQLAPLQPPLSLSPSPQLPLSPQLPPPPQQQQAPPLAPLQPPLSLSPQLPPSPPPQQQQAPPQQQPESQLIHVIIPVPNGVTAGQTFIAFTSLYKLKITVPPGVTEGQLLDVTFTLQQTEKEIIDISSDFISNNELLCIKNLKDVYINNYKRKEEWILQLELVKKYINENKKSPPRSNKDKNAKKLGVWISKQKENYKKKKYTVYNETIRHLWENFVIEYKKYI
jgi:L-rhamnose mutarotase